MANTTNYNWATPDDTDLVKDGAAAIRTLGSSIDTSLVDLLGGTTGQVLSKTSGTDMDFTWVDTDDANAIQNAIVDAKGDLVAASGADTPARLAVGNNGETLVADSSTSTGLAWAGNYAAGKNKIINGDFLINQRSFTSITANGYGFDRFNYIFTGGTVTYSAQSFTAGTAPVAGYEGKSFARIATTGQSLSTEFTIFRQPIESVRTLAGQTATISFWAKADSGTPKVSVELDQAVGTGGSPSGGGQTYAGEVTLSTSWVRYSVTVAVPSLSGATIGTNEDSSLRINLWLSAGSNFNARTNSLGIQNSTIDFWGVQVEAGSVATAFNTATGTLAGELAACQRYYVKFGLGLYSIYGIGFAASTTRTDHLFVFPVEMRVAPTLGRVGTINPYDGNGFLTTSGISLTDTTTKNTNVRATVTGATQFRPYALQNNNDATGYLEFSGEL
jgi:hypothetical protein